MTDEQIAQEAGLSRFSAEQQAMGVGDIRTVVDIRVGTILTDVLTDEQFAHFETLKNAGNDAAIWEYLQSILGADASELYEATLRAYLDEIREEG